MGKQLAVTVNAVHRVGSKMYLTTDGVHRKVKKAYLTDGGVHKLCYEEGNSIVSSLTIAYSGNMIDSGIVSMADGDYRLLTLTSSGNFYIDSAVTAEVWMCGGGLNGQEGYDGTTYYLGMGGTGAYTATGTLILDGGAVAVVGSAGGFSSFGELKATAGGLYKGGTGGGAAHQYNVSTYRSCGDGISKYPFMDSTYFKYPHCAGGGGGSHGRYSASSNMIDGVKGGSGGTNGGDGGIGFDYGKSTYIDGGRGGNHGGGNGGMPHCLTGLPKPGNGEDASYYGSGGGGGGYVEDEEGYGQIGNGGKGYQGVIYIRIPVNQ